MEKIYFEDITEGQVLWSDEVAVDHDEMLAYSNKYDYWPIHVDEELARQSPFGGIIASGGYTISLMYKLGHTIYNTDKIQWAFLSGFDWKLSFTNPVKANDRLRLKLTVLSKKLSSKKGKGVATNLSEVFNQNDERVLSIEAVFLLATRPI